MNCNKPDDITAYKLYPFGSEMPNRSFSSGEYRYGFQGQEKENDVVGEGLAYKYRIHDARIGRFLSIDPLAPDYPWNSPYAFSENKVIHAVELEGLEAHELNQTIDADGNFISSSFTFNENASPVEKGQVHYNETVVNGKTTTTTSSVMNAEDINYQGGEIPITKAPNSILGTTDYYSFRDNDFNIRHTLTDTWDSWQPSSPDYYLGYGNVYVNKFTNEVAPILSKSGKVWVEKALLNLQTAMENELNSNPSIELNNSGFTDFAFGTHVASYEKAGLLSLPYKDLLIIGTTPSTIDLFRGGKQVLQVGNDFIKNSKEKPMYTGLRLLELGLDLYKANKKGN